MTEKSRNLLHAIRFGIVSVALFSVAIFSIILIMKLIDKWFVEGFIVSVVEILELSNVVESVMGLSIFSAAYSILIAAVAGIFITSISYLLWKKIINIYKTIKQKILILAGRFYDACILNSVKDYMYWCGIRVEVNNIIENDDKVFDDEILPDAAKLRLRTASVMISKILIFVVDDICYVVVSNRNNSKEYTGMLTKRMLEKTDYVATSLFDTKKYLDDIFYVAENKLFDKINNNASPFVRLGSRIALSGRLFLRTIHSMRAAKRHSDNEKKKPQK